MASIKPEVSKREAGGLLPYVQNSYEQRYSLDFLNNDQEKEFREQFIASQIRYIRTAIFVGIILMIAFGIADTFFYYDEKNQTLLWFVRCGIIFPLALVVFRYTHTSVYLRNAQYSGFFIILIVGTIWLVLLSNDGLHRSLYSLPNLIEAAIYSLFFAGLTIKYAAPLCFIFIFFYYFVLMSYDPSGRLISALTFSLFIIIGLLMLCAYQKERITRALFIKNRQEQLTAARHAQDQQRDLNWLRGLAKFLRHEVRQPMALISSSLDIIQMNDSEASIKKHVAHAETGVRHVWNLIDRATRATDAEAFVRQSQAEIVNLGDLTVEIIEGFQQTYSGVSFEHIFDASTVLDADPALLREAIANLLSNAASFADDASIISVTIREEGRAVILSVVNQGPTIQDDAEILFGPFRSTRVGDGQEHQGLGLYLVRLVAEHYGGTAKLGNLDNGAGVIASITLPITASTKHPLQAIDSPEIARL